VTKAQILLFKTSRVSSIVVFKYRYPESPVPSIQNGRQLELKTNKLSSKQAKNSESPY